MHTYTHSNLTTATNEMAAREILLDKENLEKQFGRIIRGFAYPYGAYDASIMSILKNFGVSYARTTKSSRSFALPENWLCLSPTCHHNDSELMPLAKQFAEGEPRFLPWLFYLWGHSYEFERDDNWNTIDSFSSYLGGNEKIWYATNIEIYDYVNAWKHLVSSADGRMLFNPTSMPLYLLNGNREKVVAPGEECVLS